MARYIIIYDDKDAIERTIFFEGSPKALRDFLDKIRKATHRGCKPPRGGSGDRKKEVILWT